MKLIAIADVHISSKLPYAPKGYNRLFEEVLPTLHNVVEYAKEKRINNIFILGDFFDSISISPMEHMVLRSFINRAMGSGIQLMAIAGNHEVDEAGNAIVHSTREIISIKGYFYKIMDGVAFCAIDFCRSIAEFKFSLKKVIEKTKPPRVLLAHQAVEGAWFNSIKSINGIPEKWFSKKGIIGKNFDYCMFGDFHRPQPLPHDAGIYIGNLTQNDFKDEGNNPQFVVLDTDTLKATPVPSGAVTFHTMQITNSGIEFEEPKGKCYIRIKINGKKEFVHSIDTDRIIKKLNKKYRPISIILTPPSITDRHAKPIATRHITKKDLTDEELVTTIIKRDKTPLVPTGLLYRFGVEYLKKAREQQ